MPTMREKNKALQEAARMADAPIGVRRGLEAHGFTPAESRAIHRAAGNDNPPTTSTTMPMRGMTEEEREKLRGGRKSYGVDYGD